MFFKQRKRRLSFRRISLPRWVTRFTMSALTCISIASGVDLTAPHITHAALHPESYDAELDGVQKAFPTAEGFGKYAQGGRGGKVYIVTNLNDSGPGSLRECVEASGPRTCVFSVSGEIKTESAIHVDNPYLTIAGQTAPGDGIMLTVRDTDSIQYPLLIGASHVIVRHITVRPGPSKTPAGNLDAIQIGDASGAQHIMIDHVSMSWATDETFSASGNSNYFNRAGNPNVGNITVQWSMIYESLFDSNHTSGKHSRSTLFREGVEDITFHHNIIANSNRRNPSFNAAGQVDFVNNVIYNSQQLNGELYTAAGTTHFNWIGNVAIAGPSTLKHERIYMASLFDNGGLGDFAMYVKDNIDIHRPTNVGDDRLVINPNNFDILTTTGPVGYGQLSLPSSEITGPEQAYKDVLSFAGATLPLRDATDARLVSEVYTCAGKVIDHPSEVGGWPVLHSASPPADTDRDGMPDQWELVHDLDPQDDADRNGDDDNDGYTNLEEYLNEIAGDDYSLAGTGTGTDPDPTCGNLIRSRPHATIHSFTVTPSVVTPGEQVTITWDADADTCKRMWNSSNPDPQVTSGSETITLTESTDIDLSCQRSGVYDWKSEYIFVTPDGSVPSELSFTADQTDLNYGDLVTLTWRSGTPAFPHAGECMASGGWQGFKTVAGEETFQVKNDGSYELTCTGPEGGITTRRLVLNVQGGNQPPQSTPPGNQPLAPTASIIADPTSITVGNVATLSWTSTDADSCTASGAWSGNRATVGTTTVSPTSNATYTITCTGTGGSVSDSVSVSVTQSAPVPTASITADPTSITVGNVATLSWMSTDADSCTASGAWSGSRAIVGTVTVSPTSNATYTITCTGTGGSASDSVSVSVTQPPSTGIEVGARVSLNASSVKLRTAGLKFSGKWQYRDATGVVIDGPKYTNYGAEFWEVDFDTDPDGWVATRLLTIIP